MTAERIISFGVIVACFILSGLIMASLIKVKAPKVEYLDRHFYHTDTFIQRKLDTIVRIKVVKDTVDIAPLVRRIDSLENELTQLQNDTSRSYTYLDSIICF